MKNKLSILVTGSIVMVFVFAVYLFFIFPDSRLNSNTLKRDLVKINIPGGAGPQKIALILQDARLTSSPYLFSLWMRFAGKMPGIKAGNFWVPKNANPNEIIFLLKHPVPDKGMKITFLEGYTLTRIANTLKNKGVIKKTDRFIKLAELPWISKFLGIKVSTAEGFLFPDTYFFDDDADGKTIVKKMVTNFKKKTAHLKIPLKSLVKTVTLASIVQAEAGNSQEMPLIAGVYQNRLAGMLSPAKLLQADPTVAYGCETFIKPFAATCKNFSGKLRRRQLDDPKNPYNTYMHSGLPPGPICSPGLEALKAALKPAKTNYVFFVSNKNKGHVFSTNYSEHLKAVKKYLLK